MEDLNLEGILQSVLGNPQLLKGAMELAAKLTASGEGEEKNTESLPTGTVTYDKTPAPPSSEKKGKGDMKRHRKLLEALALYVSEDKRDKIELMIKALELFELAESMGILGGKGV